MKLKNLRINFLRIFPVFGYLPNFQLVFRSLETLSIGSFHILFISLIHLFIFGFSKPELKVNNDLATDETEVGSWFSKISNWWGNRKLEIDVVINTIKKIHLFIFGCEVLNLLLTPNLGSFQRFSVFLPHSLVSSSFYFI